MNVDEVKNAAITNSAAVIKTYKNAVGSTVFVCENEKSKDTLLPHLSKVFQGQKILTPPSRQPTVTIVGIHDEVTSGELFDIVKEQNSSRGINITTDNFKVIFIKAMNSSPGLFSAVVRVSDEIRDAFMSNGDRVCIGLNSCKIYDRYFVRRCNKCQRYGHYYRDCTSNVSVCAKCGEQHETNNCESNTNKCFNCGLSGYADTNHTTYSSKCPVYMAEQEKEKGKIYYYNKTKN